jgi:hypothetical protein
VQDLIAAIAVRLKASKFRHSAARVFRGPALWLARAEFPHCAARLRSPLDCAKEGDHSTDANVVLYRPAAVSAAAQVGLTGVGMPVARSELSV